MLAVGGGGGGGMALNGLSRRGGRVGEAHIAQVQRRFFDTC